MRQGTINFENKQPFARRRVSPLGSGFVVILAVLFSMLFIFSASLAFVNASAEPIFGDTLDMISAGRSGIIILGENVDVDVDEPSVTVRWSVLGCGNGFILPGSPGLHGSAACGVPAIPLEIFLDESDSPVFNYDPESVPVNQKTSKHIIIQAQVQFENDLVLDVHDTRLYPFDTYLVSTSLRATSSNSSTKDITVPIIGMPVLKYTPSFVTSSRDTDAQFTIAGEDASGRFIEIQIKRPSHARVYAMMIFGINWALCHFSSGIVLLSILQDFRAGQIEMLKRVAGAFVVLFIMPQMRGAMPDAPGLEGILIDTIGYFPQMTLAGLSAIVLVLITVKRELDVEREGTIPMCKYKAKGMLHERINSGRGASQGRHISSKSQWAPLLDRPRGHARNLSMRDYVLEQVLRLIDAGSQILSDEGTRGRTDE